MAALIALLIALGIISSPEDATPDLLDEYSNVVGGDIDFM